MVGEREAKRGVLFREFERLLTRLKKPQQRPLAALKLFCVRRHTAGKRKPKLIEGAPTLSREVGGWPNARDHAEREFKLRRPRNWRPLPRTIGCRKPLRLTPRD